MTQEPSLITVGIVELSLLAVVILLAFCRAHSLTRLISTGFGSAAQEFRLQHFIFTWTARGLSVVWVIWCMGFIQAVYAYSN